MKQVCSVGWSDLYSLFSRNVDSLVSDIAIDLQEGNLHYFEIYDAEDAWGNAYMRFGFYL